MAGVHVTVVDSGVAEAMERLVRFAARPAAAMKDAGEYMQGAVDDRFASQSDPQGRPWEPNTPTTLLRKRNPRILHESPLLRNSIHYRATDTEMRQGTNLVYAAAQHFGMKQGYAGTTSRGAPIPWGDIPARAFLGFSPADQREIGQIIERHIQRQWSGPSS